ncbi:hypothetical protein HDU98_002093 [Podochytrium sp. JEL0797]|nr:hypothetical protein HDU98_002093 [Podochytrium sp. JEL0797]
MISLPADKEEDELHTRPSSTESFNPEGRATNTPLIRPLVTGTTTPSAQPHTSISLKSGKPKVDPRLKMSKSWGDVVRWRYSILPYVWREMFAVTVWALLVCVFFKVGKVNFLRNLPNSIAFTVVLGTSVSLLLSFRTNTAYDRFWEGRKLWAGMKFQILNLARLVKVTVKAPTPADQVAKDHLFDLLIALPYATKTLLRREDNSTPLDHTDIAHLLSPALLKVTNTHMLPIHILKHVQNYLVETGQLTFPMCQPVFFVTDIIVNLDRIRTTPVPRAHAFHLEQSLALYLASLPFQLVPLLGWLTVPATLIAAYIMIGLREIAQKIEDPFGEDEQDLPVDYYCQDISDTVGEVKAWVENSRLDWLAPIGMDGMVCKNKEGERAIEE